MASVGVTLNEQVIPTRCTTQITRDETPKKAFLTPSTRRGGGDAATVAGAGKRA
jgi:hypothetical protein